MQIFNPQEETHKVESADQRCPLCGEVNLCAKISCEQDTFTCWCADPDIKFPPSLLDKIPEASKGIHCICKSCVVKYQAGN